MLLTAVVAIAASRIEGPLRRYVERRVNDSLTGYTVSIGALHLHVVGLAVELENVTLVQNAHPSPPMMYLPSWRTSVEWRALLSLALVADTSFQRPELYIMLEQTEQEAEDKTKLTDRGWQDAVQAVYPLKINTFPANWSGDALLMKGSAAIASGVSGTNSFRNVPTRRPTMSAVSRSE